MESWLNTRSNNKNRGVLMSLYMLTTYLGAGTGQLMLNIPDGSGVIVYILVSILYSIALVPISLTALPSPDISVHKDISLVYLYKISPIGVVSCIVSGVFVGSFYTLGAIYTHEIGLDLSQTALFMSFGIFGGMLAQLPVGRLSDKFDRRFVLMWACGLLFFVAPWIHVLIDNGRWELIAAAAILGSGTFILYPISVSHVNDLISDSERIHASGMLILLQSIGMIAGPIGISFLMQHFGAMWFLLSFSVASGAFVLFALRHIFFHPELHYVNVTPTDPVPVSPTHAFSNLAQNTSLVDKAKELFVNKH